MPCGMGGQGDCGGPQKQAARPRGLGCKSDLLPALALGRGCYDGPWSQGPPLEFDLKGPSHSLTEACNILKKF